MILQLCIVEDACKCDGRNTVRFSQAAAVHGAQAVSWNPSRTQERSLDGKSVVIGSFLSRIDGEVHLDITGPVTQRSVLDALETRYPMLCGTIRGHDGGPRRAFIRFFACQLDLSHDPPDDPLPATVAAGTEPYLIVGAMAGG